MHLKAANLWAVVREARPAPNAEGARDAGWTRKNDKAWSDIYNSCDSDQQEFIIDYEFAKDAWVRLKSLYESHDHTTIQRLYGEWDTLR